MGFSFNFILQLKHWLQFLSFGASAFPRRITRIINEWRSGWIHLQLHCKWVPWGKNSSAVHRRVHLPLGGATWGKILRILGGKLRIIHWGQRIICRSSRVLLKSRSGRMQVHDRLVRVPRGENSAAFWTFVWVSIGRKILSIFFKSMFAIRTVFFSIFDFFDFFSKFRNW